MNPKSRNAVLTRRRFLRVGGALMTAGAAVAFAQGFAYPPQLADAQVETYKTVKDAKLELWIFSPPGHKTSDKRPAIVFFFGGGWRTGSPGQFAEQCRELARRGIVACP